MRVGERGPTRNLGNRHTSARTRPCLLLIAAFSWMPAIAAGQSREQSSLFEFLKDAQVTNLASLEKGTLVAHVRFRPWKDWAVLKLETTVMWNRRNALWIYKLSDTDKLISPNNYPTEWGAELENQRIMYRLIENKKMYTYDPFDATLYVVDFNKPVGNLTAEGREGRLRSWVFDVQPETNWFQCCPPNHDDGRLWLDMIGPESPALVPDAELTVERGSDGLIRQVRIDPDGGRFELVFSPEHCGNVVKVHYRGTDPLARSIYGHYEWRKTPEGVCVLARSEFEKSLPGRPEDIDTTYTLDITSIDLNADVGPDRISLDALKSYLPPNTRFHNQVSGKSTMLNPMPGAVQDQRFHSLAEKLRSRGFLKNEK